MAKITYVLEIDVTETRRYTVIADEDISLDDVYLKAYESGDFDVTCSETLEGTVISETII